METVEEKIKQLQAFWRRIWELNLATVKPKCREPMTEIQFRDRREMLRQQVERIKALRETK